MQGGRVVAGEARPRAPAMVMVLVLVHLLPTIFEAVAAEVDAEVEHVALRQRVAHVDRDLEPIDTLRRVG